MRTLEDKLIQLKMSEKTAQQQGNYNEYTVIIDKEMTKTELAKAVQAVFGVKPTAIRTAIFRTKTKKNRYATVPAKAYKKAMIRLPEGQRIEIK